MMNNDGKPQTQQQSQAQLPAQSQSQLELQTNTEERQSELIQIGTRPLEDVLHDVQEHESVSLSLENLPSTVLKLTTLDNSCDVYLVGTAHFSRRSVEEVVETIKKVRPCAVVVELCHERRFFLDLNESDAISRSSDGLTMNAFLSIIKKDGVAKGVFLLLFLNLTASLTKSLGSAPGEEFRAAAQEARKLQNCVLCLGDRSLRITMARALDALSIWQRVKLFCQVVFSSYEITHEEMEKLKDRDLLQQVLEELGCHYPAFKNVVLDERDIYLAHTIRNTAYTCHMHSINRDLHQPQEKRRIVAVVGMGHRDGIAAHWERTSDEQFYELQKIPRPSLTRRVIGKTIKYSIYGIIIYAGYRWFCPSTIKNRVFQ